MERCTICTRQTRAKDMFPSVQELSYQNGQVITHTNVCARCASIIETRNAVYSHLKKYFNARYHKLVKLRGEYYKNRELAWKHR